MLLQLCALAKRPGRLNHGVYPHFCPGQVRWIALSEQFGAPLGGDKVPIFQRQALAERPHNGVIVEQIAQCIGIEKVVNRNHIDALNLLEDTKHRAADSTETINCNFHQAASSLQSRAA